MKSRLGALALLLLVTGCAHTREAGAYARVYTAAAWCHLRGGDYLCFPGSFEFRCVKRLPDHGNP